MVRRTTLDETVPVEISGLWKNVPCARIAVLKHMEDRIVKINTGEKTLDKQGICHVLKEIIGFVLYMHQQIPCTLQQLETEFASMKVELERVGIEINKLVPGAKPSERRKMMVRLRETKRRIKKFEKLATSISNTVSAMEIMVLESPKVRVVLLALGASSTRPQHVYEIYFNLEESVSNNSGVTSLPRKVARADVLSKKILRELISSGAGCSGPISGSMKLFLLINAPCGTCLMQHFLPKRAYKYNKKVHTCRVVIESAYGEDEEKLKGETSMRTDLESADQGLSDSIWFQCRHTVKGLVGQDLLDG